MAKKNKIKITNLDTTLKNFLYNRLFDIDGLVKSLKGYDYAERKLFVYNCCINSIYEFIQTERYYLKSDPGGQTLEEIFEQNFSLKRFEEPDENIKLSEKNEKLLLLLKFIKYDLSDKEKNCLKSISEDLLASTV